MLSERLATILPRLYVVKQQNETDRKPGIVWGRGTRFLSRGGGVRFGKAIGMICIHVSHVLRYGKKVLCF